MNISLAALLKFLNDRHYEAKIQTETQQIYAVLKIGGSEFPLFLKVYPSNELLQLLVFMPVPTKKGVEADLARLLHFINKELDLPGFGMDEQNGVAFYRCMIPSPEKKVDPTLLESYLKAIDAVCDQVAPAVLAVATGLKSFNEILDKAREIHQQSQRPS